MFRALVVILVFFFCRVYMLLRSFGVLVTLPGIILVFSVGFVGFWVKKS